MAISRSMMERQLRAGGGIMTLDEPRQGYFLGKIVRKAKKAVKKVVKSPLGKAAILGGLGFGLGGAKFLGGQGIFAGGQGLSRFGNLLNLVRPAATNVSGKRGLLSGLFYDKDGAFSPGRAALTGLTGAAVAAPFFMGGDEEEIDEGTPFNLAQPLVSDIRQQAKDYYQDPTKSALYFMPQKQFVQPSFYAAEGGLADIPREGYDNGGDVMTDTEKAQKLIDLADYFMERGMSEQEAYEAAAKQLYAYGGRVGYRVGGGILQKAGQMIKSGVGKVKSLFDDADINVSIRDEDVMTDAGLQAQAVGQDVFITPKSNKAVKVMEELIDEGYDIAKAEDGSYAISSVDEGALDIITQRLRIGSKGADEFIEGQDYFGGPIDEESKMIYDALRNRKAEGGIMDLGGMEKDYREGGFVPLGAEERADDVPARLSKNEFVFTADAVRNAGGGDIDKGAEVMQNMMDNLEAGGMISEESQGMENPAQAMFDQAQMLEGRLA